MDQNSLPPLPSAQELFAPSTSQSSSLPFIKNVNLFIPVPSLQQLANADMPPMPPKSLSLNYSEPYSPLPPQPTSPLVDQFDHQLAGGKTSDSVFQLEQSRRSEFKSYQKSWSGHPPSKKARYSETVEPASSLQYDSREEGEISDDEDDVDEGVMSVKSTSSSSYHKPLSPRSPVSHNEHRLQSASHRQVPTNCSESTSKTSALPSRHQRSSHVTERSSHHRHQAHPSHLGVKDASKPGGHHQNVEAASVCRTERSSSVRKQIAALSDGRKELDCSRDPSKTSSYRHLSSDRGAGIEGAKHDSRSSSYSSGHKGSGHPHQRLSNSGTAVTETVKHQPHSKHHHHRRSLQSDLPLSNGSSKDGSQTLDCQPSFTYPLETIKKEGSEFAYQLETTMKKEGLETVTRYRPSSLAGNVRNSGISRSSRPHHILAGSTLGSEIVKNMSRSSASRQSSVDSSVAKSALQLSSLQHQLTDSGLADQNTPQPSHLQQSLDSVKAFYSATTKDDLQALSNCRPAGHQSDSLKQITTSPSAYRQPNVMRDFAAVEATEKQPQTYERFGNIAGNCQTPDRQFAISGNVFQSYSDGEKSPHVSTPLVSQPVAQTALAASKHSSTDSQTVCPRKSLDAPYSPGSFDLDDLFVAPDVREGVSNDDNTSSNFDMIDVPCSGLTTSIEPNSEIPNVNIEDSVMEIDTADLVDELPAMEKVEMAAESATADGRGQEYEIIDDLDSNADEVDDNAAASSDNSEVEFDSGDDKSSPNKHVKSQHSQRRKEVSEASEQTRNSVEPCDEDGDDDFEAPFVQNKIVLRGK